MTQALLYESQVHIFDEPMSNNDAESRNDMLAEIHRHVKTCTFP